MSRFIANKSAANAASILRAALLASAAFGLAGAGTALARVGVTSATEGAPLGKPPQEAERVLRIGIDVQANEVIRTGTNDRAHLVFLDGTALTVGPNAQLTIDRFVYDPNTKIGELAVNASQGVLRLVGGRISKTNPITITTPTSTIGIRGGICILDVQRGRTVSTFLFGNSMTVFGRSGGTQNVTRPGSQVTTNAGAPPSPPVMMSQGALGSQMSQLEGTGGGGGSGGGNQGGQQGGGPGGQQGGGQQGGNTPNTQNTDRNVAGNSGPPGSGNGPGGPNGQQQQQLQLQQQQQQAQQAANNAVQNSNQNQQQQQTQTSTSTSTTRVIVSLNTLGRFLGDGTYVKPPSPAVTATSLGVTSNTDNDKLLASSGNQTRTTTTTTTTTNGSSTTTTSTTNTITLTVPAGSGGPSGSITVPWQTNTLTNGFSAGSVTVGATTLTDGTGYVSPNGEFFAYLFKVNGNTVGLFGGTPTTASGGTTGFPTTGIGVYSMGSIGSGGSLPFADNSTVGGNSTITNAAVVGKMYAAYSTALQQTTGQAPPDARATALQSAISIAGTGSSQQSYMGVFIGTFYRDINGTTQNPTNDNGIALSGSYNGTYRTSATGAINQLKSAESTPLVGGANAIYGTAGNDGAASSIVLTPDSLTSTAAIDNVSGNVTNITTTRTTQASYDSGRSGTQDYNSVNAATATTNPNNVGANRTTQTLNGFVGGVVQQTDSSSNVTNRVVTTSDPTALSLTTNATNNRASATATVANFAGSSTAVFNLGGTTGGNNASSAFIDDNVYAVRDRTSDVGGTTTIGGSSANVTSTTTMVSYGAAPVSGYNLCSECSFLTFGWWGGNISYGNGSAFNPNGTDRLNLATYVAGTLAIAADVNSAQSTGTYKGGMIGNVVNGGNSYIASGTYQNVWSFGSQSGAVTATFDGTTYGNGSTNTYLNASSGSVNFSTSTGVGGTSAPIVSGGRSLSLNGAFFSGGGNAVAGQAGSFGVTGTNYQAGGTFAAKKQ